MCGSEPATLLQTNVKNGDSLSVGDSCILVFYLTAAAEMLDLMPAENVKAYAEALAPVLEKMGASIDGAARAAYADALAASDSLVGTLATAASPQPAVPAGGPDSDAGPETADAVVGDE